MTGPDPDGALADARDALGAAERIFVLTGAGISAESGVPTFRGADGLWKNHRPEELATPLAFRRDPRLVWEWYAWRRGLVSACEPNVGHRALASLARERPGVRIVTQNVDGLHTLAARGAGGPDATLPLELHGSLFR
ncbi:MAG: Sir2 family NAD-dependent protein deacetylase, partial [Gemmatimonadota bacterium]